MVTEAEILEVLSSVIDPDTGKDIVTLGFVKAVQTDGSNVSFTIELTTQACPVKDAIRSQAEYVVAALPGVDTVAASFSDSPAPENMREAGAGIANIVVVASGKGGVGKSTTAVNLAVAMAQTGARVGLFDADIYGPSIPRMMGLNGSRPEIGLDNTLIPLENFGVKTMSIGFMADEQRAMVWRGQMVGSAITQMLDDVVWGELDYLFVDMPPGTGDAQLALTQVMAVTAAVMVTTPQEIALTDCRKGINMFKEVNVRTLGIVENMSTFICPHCGGASTIFDEGGAERLSQEFNTDVLAHIPLDISICQLSNSGTPVTAALPDSDQAAVYRNLAAEVARKINIINRRKINIPVIMQPG